MNKLIDKELGVIQTDMETASGDIIEHPWVGTVSTEEDIERDYEYQREQFYKLVDRGVWPLTVSLNSQKKENTLEPMKSLDNSSKMSQRLLRNLEIYRKK